MTIKNNLFFNLYCIIKWRVLVLDADWSMEIANIFKSLRKGQLLTFKLTIKIRVFCVFIMFEGECQ